MLENGNPRFNMASLFEELRRVISSSREVLDKPIPDTFLGRKTQEPFPAQDDEE